MLSMATPTVALAQDPAAASAAPSRHERERRAQSAFVAGRYQDAIELLNGLYAEFKSPVYLRNIGRSYQRLKEPDKAIAAFEEYLRRDRSVKPAERQEVQGFIAEMEALKRQQEATPPAPAPAVVSAPPPPPPPPPPAVTTPPPTSAPPAAVAPPTVETTPAPAAANDKGSGKLIGGVLLGAAALMAAGGGVFMATSWSEFNRGKREGCPGYYDCPRIAKTVERRALWGKILFGAAAVTGIAGGTVLVFSLRPEGDSTAATGLTLALEGKF
jgi:tetratricopeptide (TPR) repeat protein